jgi:hypothetical protein
MSEDVAYLVFYWNTMGTEKEMATRIEKCVKKSNNDLRTAPPQVSNIDNHNNSECEQE